MNLSDSDAEEDISDVKHVKKVMDTYFDEQEKYSKIYGEKTVVFFEMGKFYDAYSTKTKGYQFLDKFEDLLAFKFIRRDENDTVKNPYKKPSQYGIPIVSIKRKIDILIDNDYTVVLFNQVKNKDVITGRECIGVFSKGTYIHDVARTDESTNIMTVYISEEQQLAGKNLMAIGVTILDCATGRSMIHEFCSNKTDEKFGLDELIRMIQSFKPVELVVYFEPCVNDPEVIKNVKLYLEIEKYKNSHFYIFFNKKGDDKIDLLSEESFKISFQNSFFSDIYSLNEQLTRYNSSSPLEILGIEQKPYVSISLIIMLNYMKQHNLSLLKNLSHPDIYIYNKHLILGNNATSELNIIDSNNLEFYNRSFTSVYDVVNHTSTPMGKRFLRNSLINPLSQQNKKKIIVRYNIIEELLKNNFYLTLKQELKGIYDMDRLHRKMAMETITPYEFYRLDLYYHATVKIVNLIKNNKIVKSLISDSAIDDLIKFQSKTNKEMIFEILKDYARFSDIERSFFKKNVYTEIDEIQDRIDYTNSVVASVHTYLLDLVKDLIKCKSVKKKDIIKKEYNEVDKFFFTITKGNEKNLKDQLKNINKISVELYNGKKFKFEKKDIVFKSLKKGRTKIFIEPLKIHTSDMCENTELISKLLKEKFVHKMKKYYNQFKTTMNIVSNFIAELDFLVSGASVAKSYYYCKPQILSLETAPSYINAKMLRHPIIERICCETEYIPNDIQLGNVPPDLSDKDKDNEKDKNGVLLFGLNSAGKSSFMKSIGISVILAQIGYYVPATSFVYEPYMSIYARITGNDNLFKGLSCFALEMTELNAILTRTELQGQNTLVIGDEVCKGTEKLSELILVASAIMSFSECKCTFIFSSHLHKLADLEEINTLSNLRFYHLRVEYSEQKDCLVFDRKLTDGVGPKSYGLVVAKYYIKHTNFIVAAEKLKKKLVAEDMHFDIPVKSSRYNKDRLVKTCAMCKYFPTKSYHKELETHHINFQKDCLTDGKIKEKPYLHKNRLSNTVVLCRKCHVKVHKKEIIISGYTDTSIGPMLEYHVDTNKIIENEMSKLNEICPVPHKTLNKSKSCQHNLY